MKSRSKASRRAKTRDLTRAIFGAPEKNELAIVHFLSFSLFTKRFVYDRAPTTTCLSKGKRSGGLKASDCQCNPANMSCHDERVKSCRGLIVGSNLNGVPKIIECIIDDYCSFSLYLI